MAELKPLYLFHGDDSLKLDATIGRLQKRAEGEGWGLELLAGQRCAAENITAAITVMTLGAGRQVVVADGVEKFKGRQLEDTESSLAAIAPGTSLVLVARGKAPVKLLQVVKSHDGEVQEWAAPKPSQLRDWALKRAKSFGLTVEAAAAELLVEYCGSSRQRLLRELEKLATAFPAGAVDSQAVIWLVGPSNTAKLFGLTDTLLAGERERAVAQLDALAQQGVEPIRIVTHLASQLRTQISAKELLETGASVQQIGTRLKLTGFVVKKAVRAAKNSSGVQLKAALGLMVDLEQSFKDGSNVDPYSTLTLGILKTAAALKTS